jgi:transposase-like protein
MDVGRYLVEAHLKEGRSVASLARDHGLHRSWIYKLLQRYREEGEAGLAPRSRKPHTSPTQVSRELEERIVELRKELQAQLDWFTNYYNTARPHRSLHRRTPQSVYDARVKAHPGDVKDATAHFRVRHDKIDTNGTVTLRYGSRLLHLGMGRTNAGQVVTMLVADRDVRVLNPEGVLMRRFLIDPKKSYQKPAGDAASTVS